MYQVRPLSHFDVALVRTSGLNPGAGKRESGRQRNQDLGVGDTRTICPLRT